MKSFVQEYSPLHRKYRILREKYRGDKRLQDAIDCAEKQEVCDTLKKRMKLYAGSKQNFNVHKEPRGENNVRDRW